MFCPKCGAQVEAGTSFCPSCGAAVAQEQSAPPAAPPPAPMAAPAAAVKNNVMAIVSLVLGVVSFLFNPVMLCSILAIVFGIMGNSQIKKSNGAMKGKGMAMAGIILGALAFIVMIIVIAVVGFKVSML